MSIAFAVVSRPFFEILIFLKNPPQVHVHNIHA